MSLNKAYLSRYKIEFFIMNKLLMCCVLALTSFNVFAVSAAKITEIAVRNVNLSDNTQTSAFWVTLDGWLASEGARPCSTINSRWAYILVGEDKYDTVVSVLLAAKATGSEVQLGVQATSSSDSCHITDIYSMK